MNKYAELIRVMREHGCPAHSDTFAAMVHKQYGKTDATIARHCRLLVKRGLARRVRPGVFSMGPASRD